MDYYDPNNTDFLSQEEKLARAQRMAAAIRGSVPQAQMIQPESFNSAVTGQKIIMPSRMPSKAALLAPLLNDALGAVAQHGVDSQRTALSKSEREAMNTWISNQPRATTQTTNPAEILEGADPVKATVQPTDQERLAWAQGGMNNPMTKDTAAKAVNDLIVNEPVREEARAEKALARQDKSRENALNRLTQLQMQQSRNDARMAQIQLQLQTVPAGTAASNQLRAEALQLQREQNAIKNEQAERKLQIDQQNADARTTTASRAGIPKPTAKQQDDMVKAAGTISGLTNVLNNMSDTMFNPVKHSEKTQAIGANSSDPQDQKDSATWAQYRSIANVIRNQLYGSALTAHEQSAFDSTSIDTLTGKAQAKVRVQRMLDLAKAGVARMKAMQKGGEMDPETGEVIMPDGSVAPGTVTIELSGMATGPGKGRTVPAAAKGGGEPTRADTAGVGTTSPGQIDSEIAQATADLAKVPDAASKKMLQDHIEELKRQKAQYFPNAGAASAPKTVKFSDLK